MRKLALAGIAGMLIGGFSDGTTLTGMVGVQDI